MNEGQETWRLWYLLGFALLCVAGGVAFIFWGLSRPHHKSPVLGFVAGVPAVLLGLYLTWGWGFLMRKRRRTD
jgi:hypothetical protein